MLVMREIEYLSEFFKDRGAVVTGAASGIGFEIARHLLAAGAHVALLDVEEKALSHAERELRPISPHVMSIRVDVSDNQAMALAAQKVAEGLGKVHFAFNNAGVDLAGIKLADASEADWRWILGVNLLGVVHGVRHFLPLIQSHGERGHVVNTASVAGFFPVSAELGLGPYVATKHAVVGLTESLMLELEGSSVGASLLVPGTVRTNIASSFRNRPDERGDSKRSAHPKLQVAIEETGIDPIHVARLVLKGVQEQQAYVFTHEDTESRIEARHARMKAAFEWRKSSLNH
jgi:NAD(P)-dependent dehydrogenase (short-subunit alcohol dehydrogenase family)